MAVMAELAETRPGLGAGLLTSCEEDPGSTGQDP